MPVNSIFYIIESIIRKKKGLFWGDSYQIKILMQVIFTKMELEKNQYQ